MGTPHNEAEKGEIAKRVLMPGDPLRAKYIAEHFLKDAVCFNTVRNMLGYTGTYKGEKISVMGGGMGVPSVGIYTYELYHEYEVEEIIRKAGGKHLETLRLFDLYQGEQVKEGCKSMAYNLTFRAEDRTLTDKEVDQWIEKIIKALEKADITLRA